MALWESRMGLQQQDDSLAGVGIWPPALVPVVSGTHQGLSQQESPLRLACKMFLSQNSWIAKTSAMTQREQIIVNLYWLSYGLDVKQPQTDRSHCYTVWSSIIYELMQVTEYLFIIAYNINHCVPECTCTLFFFLVCLFVFIILWVHVWFHSYHVWVCNWRVFLQPQWKSILLGIDSVINRPRVIDWPMAHLVTKVPAEPGLMWPAVSVTSVSTPFYISHILLFNEKSQHTCPMIFLSLTHIARHTTDVE